MIVRKHKRGKSNVRMHKRKDKWPPISRQASKQTLIAYKERIVKELEDLRTGRKVVIPGHLGHPAFIRRRLQQVLQALKKQ
jgi:hypothetical protein